MRARVYFDKDPDGKSRKIFELFQRKQLVYVVDHDNHTVLAEGSCHVREPRDSRWAKRDAVKDIHRGTGELVAVQERE